jgi:bifunctional non-homologous end joining protein LigD
MGMESWLKTTGGKGLHVVTLLRQRLGQPTTWPEAKAFALRLCRAIEADSPTAYTTKMAKAERHGRIFLDYLRNDTTATAAALLTPRTRSGAPVSFPLRWEDLTPDLDRDAYTIWNAAELMANSDPWEGYEASARPLPS